MRREPSFLEVAALVCMILAGVIAVAEWIAKFL